MRYSLGCWLLAWLVVLLARNDLWAIAAFGFVQNVAFVFTSRARNSPSVFYHGVASLFSNGIYVLLLVGSINLAPKGGLPAFVAVYTLSTMSGAMAAHQYALKKEKKWLKS